MNRRDLLTAVAAIGLIPTARALADEGDLKSAAREAWIFALPLIEMATTRSRSLKPVGAGFSHARTLATPASRGVTGPNNDTLYSSAWIDLSQGPVTLAIPASGKRYLSVSIMDMYSDNAAILGTRTLGGGGGTFTLVGPGQTGSGVEVIRVSTPHAWVLARTLVDGEADLAAAHAVQDGLVLSGPKVPPAVMSPARSAPALDYFAGAQALLLSDPPRGEDTRLFRAVAPLGLGAGGGFDPKRFTPDQIAQIEAGVAEAKARVRGQIGGLAAIDGWIYPRANLGLYGQDYLYRAAVALGGLAALTPAEAMYMRAQQTPGRFDGNGLFRLTLPARTPVDGFWSLTMYESTPEGQNFLTANPINRYAIGDRTPGLVRRADGGLDIWIGRVDPGGERTANWLPAPAQGPLSMTFRAYLPRPEFIDGRFRLPPIVAV